ncbi:hypothetical protein S40288_09894 [Stachybotrys chartarum IBT 40288]|nr:hypothetical protein S40288_09894 [Stachybotrys chartarum IBT 40288]
MGDLSSAFQPENSRDVLDIVDSLRSQGISQYVDLPQIIVCGDQSSGKSSVLEAISGIAFPTKDALCTRFATELVLRRCATQHEQPLKVSIIPGKNRSEEERKTMEKISTDWKGLDLGRIIDQAMIAMGLVESNEVFCSDILRVEYSSPDQPHLTLVDLPGLFMAGNKDQSVEDAKLVETLVLSYMEQPRSIILAVVSAKSEFALQQITQRAREVDPEGRRTLGLITKPDTLDVGSESEQAYFELARNADVHFRLGWHVVRNRDFTMRHASNAERDAAEQSFFSKGIWASLKPNQLGVDALRRRLSKTLQDQIMSQLPRVLHDIQLEIADCDAALDKLGNPREHVRDQRRYLLSLSQTFTALVKASVEGNYSDRNFFGDAATPKGYEKRLRAQVQDSLTKFAESMRLRGHAKTIVDNLNTASEASRPLKVSRSEYIHEVNEILKRSRGRELPGTFNPLVVGELFSAQCAPWETLAKKYLDIILRCVKVSLLTILQYVADEEISARLAARFLDPSMVSLEACIATKLAQLLKPYISGHPITYNHYLTENVQKAQQKRHEAKLKQVLEPFMNPESTKSQNIDSPTRMFCELKKATEPNMENFASINATDVMEAYYKVF